MTSRATAVGLLAALVLGVASPALAVTDSVHVGSFFFEDSPSGDGQVVVTQGDRITFSFEGDAQHTATVDGMFDSGLRNPGQTYTTGTLMRPGTFTLYCAVHGTARHSSTLVIRANPSPSPSPTTAKPSPSPTKARPSPSPTRSPSARPSPSPSPSPRPTLRSATPTPRPTTTRSPSASASPSPSVVAAISSPSDAPTPSTSPSPEPVAGNTPDVVPASSIDDGAPSWLLPGAVLLLLVLLGAGAIAAGRRRQGL